MNLPIGHTLSLLLLLKVQALLAQLPDTHPYLFVIVSNTLWLVIGLAGKQTYKVVRARLARKDALNRTTCPQNICIHTPLVVDGGYMARLWSSGFELNSSTAGIEWDALGIGGTASVVTTPVRSGTYSGKINGLTSGQDSGFNQQFASAASNGPYYARFYLYIDTLPTADNTIFRFCNVAFGTAEAQIRLTSTGGLKLMYRQSGTQSQVGSTSSNLSLNQWYRVEIKFDKSGGNGANALELRLDGSTIASATNLTIDAGILGFTVGGNLNGETQTQGIWYFDDVALNDGTGSFQNSWAGDGSILHLRPNAAGDNAQWSIGTGSTFAEVDEVTPDDNTTRISTTTLNQISDFNIDDTPSAIGASDTINLVQAGMRFSSAAGFSHGFKVRIKASAGGTVEESAQISLSGTTWRTNNSAAPNNYPLTLYDLPGASTTAWTKSDLDAAQIGVNHTADSGGNANVSALWLLVDYTPNLNTDLSVAITDSITLSESIGRLLTSFITTSDSLTVSESASQVLISTPSVSDTISTNEALNIALVHTPQVSDSITTSESVSLVVPINLTVSETITTTEAVNLALVHTLSASDTITLSEARSLEIPQLISVSDTVTLSEAVQLLLTSSIQAQDSITIAESNTQSLTSFILISDTITSSESVTTSLPNALQISVSETVNITELLVINPIEGIVTNETVSVTESLQITVSTPQVQVSENITLTENVIPELNSYIALSEQITVTESQSLFTSLELSVAELILVSDNPTVALSAPQIQVIDSITVGESSDVFREKTTFTITVSDTVNTTELVVMNGPHFVDTVAPRLIFVEGRLAILIVNSTIPQYMFID